MNKRKSAQKASPDRYAAQKSYVEAQIDEGLVRVTMWVPAQDRYKALQYCANLRNGVSV